MDSLLTEPPRKAYAVIIPLYTNMEKLWVLLSEES